MEKIEVIEGEVAVHHQGEIFYFSEEFIQNHLSENWMESESMIVRKDCCEVELELFPRDFRKFRIALYEEGRK